MAINGVSFGEYHSFGTWGLHMVGKKIGSPEMQEHMIQVPGRDGLLDLSESLTGTMQFYNRTIEVTLRTTAQASTWPQLVSNLLSAIHGQRLQIIFDDDPLFYYEGRCSVGTLEVLGMSLADIPITISADPYKYSIVSTGEGDWLWDPFVFEADYARDYKDLSVDGTNTYLVYGYRKPSSPKVTCSRAMTLKVDGTTTFNLSAGTSDLIGLVLREREYQFTFTGSGTVTIDFRGGTL